MSGRLYWARNCDALKKSGLLSPAAIDVPADQILAARGGHVVAARRPGDPSASLRLDKQGEQFLTVSPAQPANCAIVVGHREYLTVG